jgi:hypothetical protein
MAYKVKRSFVIRSGGRSYRVGSGMVFADAHPIVSAHPNNLEEIVEIAAEALDTPANVTAGDPTATAVTVTWDAVTDADSYRVTTSPVTSTYNVTELEADLTGLTTATEYTISVVAVTTNPFKSNSTAGTDVVTTD